MVTRSRNKSVISRQWKLTSDLVRIYSVQAVQYEKAGEHIRSSAVENLKKYGRFAADLLQKASTWPWRSNTFSTELHVYHPSVCSISLFNGNLMKTMLQLNPYWTFSLRFLNYVRDPFDPDFFLYFYTHQVLIFSYLFPASTVSLYNEKTNSDVGKTISLPWPWPIYIYRERRRVMGVLTDSVRVFLASPLCCDDVFALNGVLSSSMLMIYLAGLSCITGSTLLTTSTLQHWNRA